jgi:hypothetical protein
VAKIDDGESGASFWSRFFGGGGNRASKAGTFFFFVRCCISLVRNAHE